MNSNIQKSIDCLDFSDVLFEELLPEIHERVTDIIQQNDWKEEGIIEALPEKIQKFYFVADLQDTISGDGFFSVFYNGTLAKIKRDRAILLKLGYIPLLNCYDEAFQLVSSKFQWAEDDTNVVTQLGDTELEDFFGEDFCYGKMEEYETRVSDILWGEDLKNHLKTIWESA
jgi:hypothetical protein